MLFHKRYEIRKLDRRKIAYAFISDTYNELFQAVELFDVLRVVIFTVRKEYYGIALSV